MTDHFVSTAQYLRTIQANQHPVMISPIDKKLIEKRYTAYKERLVRALDLMVFAIRTKNEKELLELWSCDDPKVVISGSWYSMCELMRQYDLDLPLFTVVHAFIVNRLEAISSFMATGDIKPLRSYAENIKERHNLPDLPAPRQSPGPEQGLRAFTVLAGQRIHALRQQGLTIGEIIVKFDDIPEAKRDDFESKFARKYGKVTGRPLKTREDTVSKLYSRYLKSLNEQNPT